MLPFSDPVEDLIEDLASHHTNVSFYHTQFLALLNLQFKWSAECPCWTQYTLLTLS